MEPKMGGLVAYVWGGECGTEDHRIIATTRGTFAGPLTHQVRRVVEWCGEDKTLGDYSADMAVRLGADQSLGRLWYVAWNVYDWDTVPTYWEVVREWVDGEHEHCGTVLTTSEV